MATEYYATLVEQVTYKILVEVPDEITDPAEMENYVTDYAFTKGEVYSNLTPDASVKSTKIIKSD